VTALLVLGLITLAAWWVSLLRWPNRPCRRCKGTGSNPGSNARRWGPCRHCGGTKQVRRVGATAAHALLWSLIGQALRQRRRKHLRNRREKGSYPE
jgi:hypothetical protein